jgi:Minichromosome loss protein, Mcl1, middle region
VLDIDAQSEVLRGPLPLSRGATLRWLALCPSDGAPVALDSAGVLRGWSAAFGGSWMPLLDAVEEANALWPVGVDACELRYFEVAPGGHPEVRSERT